MADFKYEIVEHIGTLSESAKGWTKELNRISWNGGEPKYDIRDWAPEHEKMGKGVTLSGLNLRILLLVFISSNTLLMILILHVIQMIFTTIPSVSPSHPQTT